MRNKKVYFIISFIIFNAILGIFYFCCLSHLPFLQITLIFILAITFIALSLINLKAFIGALLIEAFVLMLFLPMTLFILFMRSPYLLEIFTMLSNAWQVWLLTEAFIAFTLLHRSILRIKTPFLEVEMPRVRPDIVVEMPEFRF